MILLDYRDANGSRCFPLLAEGSFGVLCGPLLLSVACGRNGSGAAQSEATRDRRRVLCLIRKPINTGRTAAGLVSSPSALQGQCHPIDLFSRWPRSYNEPGGGGGWRVDGKHVPITCTVALHLWGFIYLFSFAGLTTSSVGVGEVISKAVENPFPIYRGGGKKDQRPFSFGEFSRSNSFVTCSIFPSFLVSFGAGDPD